ncbi:MAG TPA: hypothetical protein VMF60_10435 [Acidimicrobiales bacterium]|nr:hypothetical protein [Acidimicrobiales bacterium]
MSACVILRIKVDPQRMQRVFADRADDFRAVSEQAKAAGALRHHFAAGEGEVVVVDEWDKGSSFEGFFDNPTIASLMAEAGVEGPPEVTVYEIMDSPDRF